MQYHAVRMPSIVWKGQLTFGLVSIPVKLYRAARRERVRMHYVHRPESEPERELEFEAEPERAISIAPPTRRAIEDEREPLPPPVPVSRVRQSLVSTTGEQPVSRA